MIYGVEEASLLPLMTRGNLDVTSQWHPTEVYRALANNKGIKLTTEVGAGYLMLSIHTKRPPTDDVHFRRAITLALDYDTLIEMSRVDDKTSAANYARGPLPSTMLGYTDRLPLVKRDLAAAKKELAKSKYAKSAPPLEISWVSGIDFERRLALLFQQNLAELGIKATIKNIPWPLLTEQVSKSETTPHIAQVFKNIAYPDPDSFLWGFHSSVRGTYESMWWLEDEELDKLLEAGRKTINESERAEIYYKVQSRINKLRPVIPAFEMQNIRCTRMNVYAPSLEEKDKTIGLMGGNFRFFEWSVD
jgi:peptide/nickel transport system substrate-binding protein